MRRTAVLALVAAAAALATPRIAGAFGPPSFQVAPGGAPAACLESAGDRVAYVAGNVTHPEVELLGPGPLGGLFPAGTIRLGPLQLCPSVAAVPGGPVAVAGWTGLPESPRLHVAVAGEPGPPVRLAQARRPVPISPDALAVAVGPAGDILVAWVEALSEVDRSGRTAVRIRAVRRPPGGGFGAAQTIRPRFTGDAETGAYVAAGVDGAGAATVVWARQEEDTSPVVVEAVTAPSRDAPFGARQRLTRSAGLFSGTAVATTPGGATLVAYGGDRGLSVHERAAPGQPFGPVARVGEGDSAAPAVALREDGGAVLAWRTADEADADTGVAVTTRAGPGAFRPPQRVALGASPRPLPEPGRPTQDDFYALVSALGGLLSVVGTLIDLGPMPPEVALGPDGRFTVAWLGAGCVCPGGDDIPVPRAAAGSLDSGAGPAQRLGAGLRSADAVAAYVAGGEPGAAWSDNEGGWVSPGFEAPWSAGRIGAASASPAAAPVAPPPALRLAPVAQRLAPWERLRVRATCDAPCDLRAVVPGRGDPLAAGAATLPAAGTTEVRLSVAAGRRVGRRPRVVVRAAARSGGGASTARLRLRVRPRRSLGVPRIAALSARREGDEVAVAFRATSPTNGMLVVAGFKRNLLDGVAIPAGGRTRFAARLQLPPGRRPTHVHVGLFPLEHGRDRVASTRLR